MSEPGFPAPGPHRPNIRLSLAWFGVGALLFTADWSSLRGPPTPGDNVTYFVVVHHNLTITLPALFGLFGALYLGMTPRFPIRLRSAIGWAHLAVMSAGAALIEAPHLVLSWVGIPTDPDLIGSFQVWSRAAALGYVLLLASLLIFVWALIDGLRRRPSGSS